MCPVEADIGLPQHLSAYALPQPLAERFPGTRKISVGRSGETSASSTSAGTGCAMRSCMVSVDRTAITAGIVVGVLLWGNRAVGPHFIDGDGKPFSLRLSPWFLEEVVDVPSRFRLPSLAPPTRFTDRREQRVPANASLGPCGAGDGQPSPSTEWLRGCPIR